MKFCNLIGRSDDQKLETSQRCLQKGGASFGQREVCSAACRCVLLQKLYWLWTAGKHIKAGNVEMMNRLVKKAPSEVGLETFTLDETVKSRRFG